MLIFTAKLNRKKLLAIVILAAFALGALILSAPDKEEAAFAPAGVFGKGLKTNEDRVAFLENLGYQVEPQPLRSQQVAIPHQFDQVYQQYNEMQRQCGFDLEPYQGKTMTLYTYRLLPGSEQEQQETLADLLVYRNRAAGGAVYSTALDGFMHGLSPAEE